MARTLLLKHGDREYAVRVDAGGQVRIEERTLGVRRLRNGVARIEGLAARLAWTAGSGDRRWVFLDGRAYELEVQRPGTRGRRASHPGSLTAPMPATVRRIPVSVGEAVNRGDTLVILEAMKMELPVRAPADASVTAILCREGELVQPGTVLVEVQEQ